MPLYEYKCESCGDRFEKKQRFSDAPLTVHENCGGRVERLISAPALQFKGSGWYVTDYRKSGAENSSSRKEQKSGSGAKETPKTEAPAKKPDSK